MKVEYFTIIALLLSLNAFAEPIINDDDQSTKAIEARLAPIGIVDIAGQTKIASSIPNDAAIPDRSGKEIYENVCYVCHGTGAANSPKFGSASAWVPRKAKGMKKLLEHALNGYNFMPPRGTCTDCSNAEVEEAIRYMLSKSTPPS